MSLIEQVRRVERVGTGATVLSGLVVVVANWSGVSWSWDSTDYVAAGRSMAKLKGSLDVSGAPMTVRPPGYPALIALGEFVNAPTNLTLLVINVASMMIATACLYVVLKRCASMPTAAIGTLFFAVTPTMVWQTSMAWSEPPFVATLMVALVIALWFTHPARYAVLGMLSVALFFLRFVGPIFIAPIIIVAVLVDARNTRWAKAIVAHLVTLGVSLVPMVWWLMRNRRIDGTLTGARQPGGGSFWETLTHAFGTYGSFVSGQPFDSVIYQRVTNYPVAAQIGALVVAGALIMTLLFMVRDALRTRLAPTTRELVVLANIGIIVGYSIFSAYRFVHFELGRLDTRMMMPVLPSLIIVIALTIERLLLQRGHVARVVVIATVVLASVHAAFTVRDALNFGTEQRHLSNAVSRNLDLHVYVRSLPDDSALYSNAPQMLFLSADTWPIFTPWQVNTPWPTSCERRYAIYYNDFQVQDNRPTSAPILYEDPIGTVYDVGRCADDINVAWD